MKNKILYFFPLLLILLNQTLAQPVVEFEELNYDFGQIQEGNIAMHDFVVKNTGNQPLIINSVRASCGCTTPYWTKEPIQPGKSGVISAAYNSTNRPGTFKKSINVVTNAVKPVHTLYINGVVVKSKPLNNYSEEQLAKSPKLEADSQILAGKIEKGQKIPLEVNIKNSGENPLLISAIRSKCNCVMWNNFEKQKIKKNEEVVLNLIYSPRNMGSVKDEFTLYSNDLHHPQKKIIIKAEIVNSLDTKSPIIQNEAIKF